MRLATALGAIATTVLTSCATLPASSQFERSRAYQLDKDVVWANIVEYFAAEGIAVKTIEKDSGIIYAERMQSAVTRLGLGGVGAEADCGSDPFARPLSQSLDLNVFVRPSAGGGTTVTVNARFRETRQAMGAQVVSVECASRGLLERDILDIAGGAPPSALAPART